MELKLKHDHTKNGILLPAGSMIDVHEAKVDWYLNNGIAEKVEIEVPASAQSDEVSSPAKKSSRKKRGRTR